jgi:autotransporter-associated beta strand protein
MKPTTAIPFLKATGRHSPCLWTSASVLVASTLLLSVPSAAFAGDATWDLNPGSGDWNTATNWMPITVPNGAEDTATFGLSNTTSVSVSANTEVNGITFAAGATNPFTITASPTFALTLSGTGITNNSGVTQNLKTAVDGAANAGLIWFSNSATAGSHTTFTNNGAMALKPQGNAVGGSTQFHNNSTAGSGTFINNGSSVNETTQFGGKPNGGGSTEFFDNSTAANATFINNPAIANGGSPGVTFFFNSSSAGNGVFINNSGLTGVGGFILFFDNSTAANATFTNNPDTAEVFWDSSTAGNATFTNKGATATNSFPGEVSIFGGSAGNATFMNYPGTVAGAAGGEVDVRGNASNGMFINIGAAIIGADGGSTQFVGGTGANGTLVNYGGTVSGANGGFTRFAYNSTAGNATITNNGGAVSGAGGGFTEFLFNSTAGNATLIANGAIGGGQGGKIFFEGDSAGGTSRVEVFGNGNLDLSLHNALSQKSPSVQIGSIEGDGNVFLGANNLGVGSNNLSTAFSGVIHDGGQNGGTGGSLTKIGTGTLVISGANTYTGDTNVNSGVLKIDGSITSNTFVHRSGTLAGTGRIEGSVTNKGGGTVSPGDGPGTLTVNSYSQISGGTLLIDIAGGNTGQLSVLNVLGTANLGGLLDPVLLNGFVPTIGESFTFLDYGAVTGSLFIFDRNVDGAAEHWDVTYASNNAILTVAPGNVSTPDRGSTFLLLTLSLLGVVTSRHFLLCKQA